MNRILFLLCIAFAACTPGKKNDPERISIEDISLTDLSGKAIDLSQYKGKTVFINFWATWCGPCLQEMPTIALTMTEFKDQPIVFLFASNESLDQIEKFRNKQPFKFEYVHSNNLEALNIQALPTTFIFNAQGELRFDAAGFREWNDEANHALIKSIIDTNE
ncbi:MAG: TlpA family protein disulfide reductase [Cyclobacteriaceae bacterium]|jgi:thiol-disulfide isomerase/thioredoxin|nr:TlpA family protein disulfide reductase [Cyclobacteriaceae bacterium]